MSIFNSVKINRPKRSTFDLSHDVKLTTDFGRLTPISCIPVLPGDVIKMRSESYIRLAPMLAPIMHRCNAYVHHFFVPSRLLWENFETFITGGKNGNELPVYPRLMVDSKTLFLKGVAKTSTLWDYLGYPTLIGSGVSSTANEVVVDPLPFLAYYKIWQYYYSDQNLENYPIPDTWRFPDGVFDWDSMDFDEPIEGKRIMDELFALRNRCWEKDYFTSALPFPQRGDDVKLPIHGMAPVVANSSAFGNDKFVNSKGNAVTGPVLMDKTGVFPNVSGSNGFIYNQLEGSGSGTIRPGDDSMVGPGNKQGLSYDPNGRLQADLSSATETTVNEFRRAFSIQRFNEAKARIGWRFWEYLQGIWGVRNPDSRLQRPEYLGGGKAPVVIGEVLQTSQTTSGTDGSPLGDMAGRGVSSGNDNGFRRKFTEYGYVISILSVIPRSAYSQGWPRIFNKFDPMDYGNPYFAHLGEQEVKNGELFFDFSKAHVVDNESGIEYENGGSNGETFGYQSRYSEYKYIPSSFHGDFRSNMSYWHLGRLFNKTPALNPDFVTVHEDETSRIFNVEDANGEPVDHLWIQIFNNIKANRCLPYYGTPSL